MLQYFLRLQGQYAECVNQQQTTDEVREVLAKDQKLADVLEEKGRVGLGFNQEGTKKMLADEAVRKARYGEIRRWCVIGCRV